MQQFGSRPPFPNVGRASTAVAGVGAFHALAADRSTDAAPLANQGECTVEGCTNEAEERGLCRTDYVRWLRQWAPVRTSTGRPQITPVTAPEPSTYSDFWARSRIPNVLVLAGVTISPSGPSSAFRPVVVKTPKRW